MLSIGKVGGGDADPRYYIESVAQGREDYYSGRGEAPGTWTGTAAADKGLTGTVEEDQFVAALTDGHPSRKVLGFDLTFSAPKSVSILFGVGNESVSLAVRDAHDAAVEDALGYVERHAAWTRRGHAGREQLQGEGLTIAKFRHRASRAGDPQLHTHAVVANGTSAEGKESALDSRALYAHARTAGFLYQAALRAQLTERVGIEWEPVENGVAEVRGIDVDVRRTFSRRREEILEHMQTHGGRSARSAQVAVLETRRVKDYDVAPGRLHDEWRARASEHGLGRAELDAVLDRRAPGRPPSIDADAAARRIAAPGGVTLHASTFDRRDVLRDWAEAHRDGIAVSDAERLADEWIASPHAVRLESGAWRAHLGGARYSTPDMLDTESRLLSRAVERAESGIAQVDADVVDEAVASQPLLSDEQREMVESVTRSGDGVQVIRAAAGSGKTFALSVARDAWERSGVPIYGCALAARAAVEMESLAGIDSTTIARVQHDIDHGYPLPHGSVLVVDEAGMVGSRALAQLASHAEQTHSKLLLVGDDHQLPEIDAGGAFRGLAERLGAVELRSVRRQAEEWDRAALTALRGGKIEEWAEAYRSHGRLVARPTATASREALVDDWWESARKAEDAVMIAHRRVDVADLNSSARARMHRDGRLGQEELVAAERAFAVGDRVLARRNDPTLGIVNGTRGEVVAIDADRRTVSIDVDEKRPVEITASYLDDGWLEHGYALTAHAAQGATVARAFVLGSDDLYREWGYTSLSRHAIESRYYVVSPGSVERALPGLEPDEDDLMTDVISTLDSSRRKHLAVDVLKRGSDRAWQPTERSVAEREAEAARERAESLDAEVARMSRWQRGRGDVAAAADAERASAARWAERAERFTAADESPTLINHEALEQRLAQETRQRLVERSEVLTGAVGERPTGLATRDEWTVAAARAVRTTTTPAMARDIGATMSDTGLDL